MRFSAVLGVAALALSAAAIAQVGSTPVEQKPDAEAVGNNVVDGPPLSNAADEAVAYNAADEPVANDAATVSNTVAGDPVEASSKPPRD